MRRFHFYIDVQGHALPLELTVEVASAARARDLAQELLDRSPNHIGVEVCEQGQRVFGIGTFATRTHCGLKRSHARRWAFLAGLTSRAAAHAPPKGRSVAPGRPR